MKSVPLFVCASAIFFGLIACKKTASSPVDTHPTIYPNDTALFQFSENGIPQVWTDIFVEAPTYVPSQVSISIQVLKEPSPQTGRTTNVFTLQAFHVAEEAGTDDLLSLQLNIAPDDSALTTGTFTYSFTSGADTSLNPNGMLGVGSFSGSQWGVLLSDTVTITSITKGYADGTFSATLGSSPASTIIHITDGAFRNLSIQNN